MNLRIVSVAATIVLTAIMATPPDLGTKSALRLLLREPDGRVDIQRDRRE